MSDSNFQPDRKVCRISASVDSVLFQVGGAGEAGGRLVRVAGLGLAVVAVVDGGGEVAFGVGHRGGQPVGGVGEAGVGLGQRRADGPLDGLYPVVGKVGGLGDAVAAFGRGEVFCHLGEAVEVVVDVVGDRGGGGSRGTGGGRGRLRRPPGFEQLAAGGVGLAGDPMPGATIRVAGACWLAAAQGFGAGAIWLHLLGMCGLARVVACCRRWSP